MKALYIKKTALKWNQLASIWLKKDRAGRFTPTDDAPKWLHEYLSNYRTPSRSWPFSYAKACLSQKFAKVLSEKEPDLAQRLGIAQQEK
jgi:hypothetical protein